MLTVGSLFSGVGGFDLGLERAGMRVVFQCERDEWCRGILARHWPGVPCYDDVRSVAGRDGLCARGGVSAAPEGGERPASAVDLLCGGFPCQDLSVAGRRAGLAGERSGLFFEFARVADELVRPGGWVVVENVPGLLSSAGGRDFAGVVRTLGDVGFHDLAWRVLDSRYFGVPQRRRRVFIVGRRAAGPGAREVLLEPESGGGDFAPRRETRARVAASLSRGSAGPGVSAPGRRQEDDENLVNALTRGTLTDYDDNTARAGHLIGVDRGDEHGAGMVDGGLRPVTGARRGNASEHGADSRLNGASAHPHGMRATPELSRRLDDPRPDGPRYAAMGNAVTVNVAEWIGRRIVSFEAAA